MTVRRLTPRHAEVLGLVAAGYTSLEIGRRLCIQASTVNGHVKTACRLLGVRGRLQAVLALLRLAQSSEPAADD
jgi:DNA-binding CsgD family transcriptional regulator